MAASGAEAQWRCDDERVVETAEEFVEEVNAGGRLRMVEVDAEGSLLEAKVNGLLWDDHKTPEALYRLTYVLGGWLNCVVRPSRGRKPGSSVTIVSQHNGELWAFLHGDLTEEDFALSPKGRKAAGIGKGN